MTKGRAVVVRSCGYGEEQTADLSTPLRSGRDDKGEDGCSPQLRLWGRTDRRCLHSGTLRSRGERGGRLWSAAAVIWKNRPQISPLRYAPVEMTKGRTGVVRSCGYG